MTKVLVLNDKAIPLDGAPFTDIHGVQHAGHVLDLWSDAELAAIGVYEPKPAEPPPLGYRIKGQALVVLMGRPVYKAVSVEPIPIHELRAPRHQRREAVFRAQLNRGLEVELDGQTLHIPLDDVSLAHLGNMLSVAQAGGVWPEGYVKGWLTVEGPRYPLPTPQAGIDLAIRAIAYHSDLVHADQDMAEQIEAADSLEALNRVMPR